MIRRFTHCILVIALVALSTGCVLFRKAPPRPNIILIMADDLGYECIGANGSATYKTPNLDRLAANGVRFTHCYSQPLCTPSRVQIMTGQYNHRNYTEFGVLRPGEKTFAHFLKNAGYATAVTGKWQLYGFDNKRADSGGKGSLPEECGFDDYCLWQMKRPRDDGERYADPLVSRKGEGDLSYTDGYGPDVFCDFALEFIGENAARPFFLYFPMALTHSPFQPTPDSPAWKTNRDQKDDKYFKDMVEYTDKIVGRIESRLTELGIDKNTLILFTGDNGTLGQITSRMNDGRNIRGGKGNPDDSGMHVPLIASWPSQMSGGSVCEDLIDFSDFLPTLAEVSGARIPWRHTIDGRSFAPQLRGERGKPREWIYCYYNPNWGNHEKTVFARTKRWKLYDDGRYFDLALDPDESHPLAEGAPPDEAEVSRMMLEGVIRRMK